MVGLVGCTGSCTGDHLHFEVRVNGAAVDPLLYLPGGRLYLHPSDQESPPQEPDAGSKSVMARAMTD